MSSRFFNIFSLGVKKENPEYINNKIQVSNQVAFFSLLIAGLPFCAIFYHYLPSLLFLPILASISVLIVPVLNFFGSQKIARTLASLNGLISVGIVHGFMVESGEPPLPASIAYELAFSLLPFIIFHPKERKALFSLTAFSLLFICFVQFRIDFLELPHESIDFMKHGIIKDFSIITASVMIYLFLWIISTYSFNAEKKQQQLVNEMHKQNEAMKQSEQILRESLKTLDESKIEEQKRLWVTEGITKFARILRNETSDKTIYDKVLSEMIKYVQANQGAFYIVEEKDSGVKDDVIIKQVSCYAYSRKKFTEQILEPGEGLLGQCYFERDIKLLTEVPDDYISITSGVGEATPSAVVIVPLILNDDVAGFLELASFQIFDDHVLAFLKRASESLASFILNNRVNERSTNLLAKSQEQTEMLRSQEEEMRQNFEELQTTQEEMHRVQKELRNVKENLETELKEKLSELENYKSNIDVLMTTSQDAIIYTCGDGKIHMNNPRTVTMFGYKQEELNGMSINELLISPKKQVTDCFSEIREGKSKMYEFFIGKSKQYGFEFHTEIKLGKGKNEDDEVISIMVRDITKRKKREESMQKNFAQMQKIQQTLRETQKDFRKVKSDLEAKEKELETLKKS